MNRARAVVGGVALALSSSAPAQAAEEVWGTRGGGAMVQAGHDIEVQLHRGYANLVVRRTLQNDGTEIDEANFDIRIPVGAVATGLRTLGLKRGKPKWYAGDLMSADRAEQRYARLTGRNPNFLPKDPAILYWTSPESLAMHVFPIPPDTDKTVEYTLTVPAAYEGASYKLHLPLLGTADFPATYRLAAEDPADEIRVDGVEVERGHRLVPTADSADGFDVRLTPSSMPRILGSFASVSMGKRRVVHFDLAAAPRLTDLPVEAQVVVVLDASRSVDASAAQAQHTAAIGFLHHLEDASVAVLHFDRDVRDPDPAFVDAKDAIVALAEGPPDARNGSAVEVALRHADTMLAARPADQPRRIVVLSDQKTRASLKPKAIKALGLSSGAIVHIAAVVAGEPKIVRVDAGPWAELCARTGGVRWSASADRRKALSPEMKRVYEGWARPVRIDALRLNGARDSTAPSLREGEGIERLAIVKGSVRSLNVSGKLWSVPVRKTFKPTRETNRRWAALATNSDLRWDLSRSEVARLGRVGQAVTRETSYLAIEPGVRPSSAGFEYTFAEDDDERVVPRVRSAKASLAGGGRPFDPGAYLTALLSDAFESCGTGDLQVDVEVETTGLEILDVQSIVISGSDDAKLKRCLEEAAWSVELPMQFGDYDRELFALNVNW